jgi:hypothetical protein
MSRVFRVLVEVGHMEGTQLPSDCRGAFVNVYVGSVTLREALDKAEAQLLADRYKPIDIPEAYELDSDRVDYDTDEKGYPGNEDLKMLRETGDTWYGPFNLYPWDEGG